MRNPLLLGCLALLASIIGCSSGHHEEAVSSSGAVTAFTVDKGDRFVVSAAPEHVVLRKRVADIEFPFNEKSLLKKAILIHAVEQTAREGVYSRVLAVHSENDQYIIDAQPLTLDEMEKITEDEIVRIYIDAAKSAARKDLQGGALVPESFGNWNTLHPTAVTMNGLGFNGFDVSSGLDFNTSTALTPGVSVTHKIEKASFRPEVLADWSKDGGLELGFRGEMEWKSSLVLNGKLSGEIFHSTEFATAPIIAYVPIGPVPVPVALKGKAFVTCGVGSAGPAQVTVTVEASASLGGSFRVQPEMSSPENWAKPGQWPAEAKGSAKAGVDADAKVDASVSCALPRIEVSADVAGVAGPYLALSPTVTISTSGATMSARVSAGVAAGALGLNGAEVTLYTWEP